MPEIVPRSLRRFISLEFPGGALRLRRHRQPSRRSDTRDIGLLRRSLAFPASLSSPSTRSMAHGTRFASRVRDRL